MNIIDFKFELNQLVRYSEVVGKVIGFYRYKQDKPRVQIEWLRTDGGLSDMWVYIDELEAA